ncbi:MAG: hypothetical protein ACYCZK_04090 [Microbacteriaceae bacterium]
MINYLATTAGPGVPGVFLTWGPFMIQLGNLIVIISMLVLFGLALVLPFPGGRRQK